MCCCLCFPAFMHCSYLGIQSHKYNQVYSVSPGHWLPAMRLPQSSERSEPTVSSPVPGSKRSAISHSQLSETMRIHATLHWALQIRSYRFGKEVLLAQSTPPPCSPKPDSLQLTPTCVLQHGLGEEQCQTLAVHQTRRQLCMVRFKRDFTTFLMLPG